MGWVTAPGNARADPHPFWPMATTATVTLVGRTDCYPPPHVADNTGTHKLQDQLPFLGEEAGKPSPACQRYAHGDSHTNRDKDRDEPSDPGPQC